MAKAFILIKIEKYLFYILLFAIPFQTRKILWYPGWRFNEWQSVSLYLTDIMLGLLLLFWLYNSYPKLSYYVLRIMYYGKNSRTLIQNTKYIIQKPEFYLIAFVFISAISIKNSSDVIISWFQFVKLLEFVIFYFYLKNYAIYKFGFTNSLFSIFYGGLFQAVISIVQFIRQSDIGLRYLGESLFNADIRGVAAFYDIYGDKVIRSYGTTPHPNVLSAYLFLAIFAFYFIWLYKKTKYENVLFYAHLAVTWALFYTFARVSAFALGANYLIRGCLSAFKFPNSLKKDKVRKLMFFTGVIVILFVVLYWSKITSRVRISGEEDAVQLRNFYNEESLKIISWTGTGIGDFVNELAIRVPMLPSYLYQPVHNIYLLIYSETGILGISMFVMFLAFLVRDFIVRTKMERFHHYSLLLLFSSFLFMGLFDHFLWTLQQGRFVFWLVLASLAVSENDDTN